MKCQICVIIVKVESDVFTNLIMATPVTGVWTRFNPDDNHRSYLSDSSSDVVTPPNSRAEDITSVISEEDFFRVPLQSLSSDDIPLSIPRPTKKKKKNKTQAKRVVNNDEFPSMAMLEEDSPSFLPDTPPIVPQHGDPIPGIVPMIVSSQGQPRVPLQGEAEEKKQSDFTFKFDAKAAVQVALDTAKLSENGRYSVDEKLLLYLSFFFLTGFTCPFADFEWSRLSSNMNALWEKEYPGGLREAVAQLRRPEVAGSEAPVSMAASVAAAEQKQTEEKKEPSPENEEEDLFDDLAPINEAAKEYQSIHEAMEDYREAIESRVARVGDEQGVLVVDRPSQLAEAVIADARSRIEVDSQETDTEEDEEKKVDSRNLRDLLVSEAEAEDAKEVEFIRPVQRTRRTRPFSHAEIIAEDEAEREARSLVDAESVADGDVVNNSDHEAKEEDEGDTGEGNSELDEIKAEQKQERPQESKSVPSRRRGYVTLAVDDGSKWAQRASARAAYWTRQLAELKRQGHINDEDWDGSEVTAKQWNEKSGSPRLRAMFTRDRLVEYQAHRREMIRGASEGEGARRTGGQDVINVQADQLPSIPFDPKVRRSRKRKVPSGLVAGQPVVSGVTAPLFKRGPLVLDESIDFGKSMPAMTLRELLQKTNITKWSAKGHGLLEKAYHTLIVNPRRIPLVGDNGDAHFMSTMVSKVCLRTMLFLANPEHGEPLMQGISSVVFQVGFEDIFNLFRVQPQYIPAKYTDLFMASASTYDLSSGRRWNKPGTPRKFASFVDQWTRKILTFQDEFKQMILLLNGLIQFQVADEAYSGLTVGKSDSAIMSLFNPDDMGGTVALLVYLGVAADNLLDIISMIKLTFEDNINYFMRHALSRLSARLNR